jgi:signal transduction histidine kinase/DNA-binding response OmpR family regulator
VHAPFRPTTDDTLRLAALRTLGPFEATLNDTLDHLVDLAQSAFGVAGACITLLDEQQQWIKASAGLTPGHLPRDISFCVHTIQQDELLVVRDALLDPRFVHNPLVIGPPHLRFYAGAPLHGPGGFLIGALCLLDVRPHLTFEAPRQALLVKLAAAASAGLAQRAGQHELAARLALETAARQTAEQTLSVKTDFIETMSHEIRTPLNGIIGMTEMLLASPLRDDQAYYAAVMQAAAGHLGRVVNEVLNIAKLEAGVAGAAPSFALLDELVAAPISMLAGNRKGKLGFGVIIEPAVPAEVAVDAMRLRQVLLNLLNNALKFTETGGVWIEISSPGPNGEGVADITFAVHDTGIGIAADELPKLFARFSQLPAGEARHYGGSGLGLAICQHLVRLMGGVITVSSVQGKGSVFAFTLPLLCREAAAPPPAGGRRILLVEPDPIDRRIIASQLIRLGAVPTIAADAKALAAILNQGEAFDALILDEATAERLGLAAALRADTATLGRTPVFLTTHTHTATEPGARLLPKPIAPATWRAALCPDSPAPAIGAAIAAAPAPLRTARPLNILLVEDNEINQIVAAAIVKKLGHEVTTVAGGVAAIAAVAAGAFDVVLMDMMMPEVDGPTASRAIRKLRGPQANIYIIALTANASLEHQRQCTAAGMNDFLTKPVARPRMEEALARYRDSQRR